MWSKIRSLLTKLTDLLLRGRQAGLWETKPGPGDVKDNEVR